MAIGIDTTIRNNRLQVIMDALDAGVNAGYIEFYTGTRPATGGALAGNTLLGTCTLSKPSGTIANGVFTFDTISDDQSADNDGTMTWCRFFDGDGTFVMDASVGLSGSTATVIATTVNIITGGVIRVTSGSLTEGGA